MYLTQDLAVYHVLPNFMSLLCCPESFTGERWRSYLLLLPDTATWAMSSQAMQDHFGTKSANWLAIGVANIVSNFIRPSWVEPWNEVETSCHEWSDAHEGNTMCMSNRSTSTSVSDGPQSFSAKELTY